VHLSKGGIVHTRKNLVDDASFCEVLGTSLEEALEIFLLVMLRLCLFLKGLVFSQLYCCFLL
jgi:hypothetical protein